MAVARGELPRFVRKKLDLPERTFAGAQTAASWCPRDEQFSASVREAFRAGSSPGDFPQEHYERTWFRRFTEAELNTTGRHGFNLG
jgi:hypothetical protein